MPTIELVSIGCPEVPNLPQYPSFAYKAETTLRSHRDRFQNVFDTLSGVIVHLADKDLEHANIGWFAGMLMVWDEDRADELELLFRQDTFPDIQDLMIRLMRSSPQHRITFSSDVQGDEYGHCQCGEVTLSEFLRLHDKRALRYNCLWYIRSDPH